MVLRGVVRERWGLGLEASCAPVNVSGEPKWNRSYIRIVAGAIIHSFIHSFIDKQVNQRKQE